MERILVEKNIRELESLRRQAQWWRLGLTGVTAGIVLVGLANIQSSVRGLTEPGPRQEAFVRELSQGVERDVVPRVQTIATRILVETRPLVEQEARRLSDHLPELSEFATEELQQLQNNVTQSGEKAIEATLLPMLEKKETKLREMFPEASEQKVASIVDQLQQEGTVRAANVSDQLFGPHQQALEKIVTHLETIRLTTTPTSVPADANWETGLALLDLVNDELQTQGPGTVSTTVAAKASPTAPTTTKGGQ